MMCWNDRNQHEASLAFRKEKTMSRLPRLWQVVFVAFVITLAEGSQLLGQTVTGKVSGTVMDASGQVIPNATVKLLNERTGEMRSSSANESGGFSFAALLPGSYTIK